MTPGEIKASPKFKTLNPKLGMSSPVLIFTIRLPEMCTARAIRDKIGRGWKKVGIASARGLHVIIGFLTPAMQL
jgi:hypothetical protein